jgi:hypothetical protein
MAWLFHKHDWCDYCPDPENGDLGSKSEWEKIEGGWKETRDFLYICYGCRKTEYRYRAVYIHKMEDIVQCSKIMDG